MITNIQKEYLSKILSGEIDPTDNPKRHSAMMISIQKQIDGKIDNTVWLAENCIGVLKDEGSEIDNSTLERYRRFKAFAYILSKLDPTFELGEVKLSDMLIKLSHLYPKFYFEAIRKSRNGLSRN